MGKKKEATKAALKTGLPTKALQFIVRQYRKIFPNATVKEALEKAGVSGAESIKSGVGSTIKKGAAAGAIADLGHYGLTGESWIGKKLFKAKGGYVKMNKGGSADKKKSSSSKKSRGTGAAIRGTKFKGVF